MSALSQVGRSDYSREFCKEEVVMSETKRMADEANRMGQQAQEGFQTGLEAASRSFTEANKGFKALASEMTDFSKRRFEDVFRAWEPKGHMKPTRRRYPNSERCNLGTVRNASKPVEESSRRFR
jgi:hypothetical protein